MYIGRRRLNDSLNDWPVNTAGTKRLFKF